MNFEMRWSSMGVWRLTFFIISCILLERAWGQGASTESFRNQASWQKDWFKTAQETLEEAVKSPLNENVAKNVILFLGDGMGVTTVTAGRIYKAQKNNQFPGEDSSLAFDRFPYVGLSKTYNVDYQVPDSAATATAFLCGVKANLGTLGVSQTVRRKKCEEMSDDNSVDSVLRWSLREGKRAGVVTTTRVTHATPAASYAHSPDRNWEADNNINGTCKDKSKDITKQLVEDNQDINVILGGGRKTFLPADVKDPEYPSVNGTRLDGINLIQTWINNMKLKTSKYSYVWNQELFDKVDPDNTDFLLGLFEPSHMQFGLERHKDGSGEPTLAEMTEKAIRVLRRSKNGFFLLVEGGKIDHGHHMNLAKAALDELASFDDAVAKAVSMTDPKDTLIVVTADHSHVLTMSGYPSRGNPILGFVDWRSQAEERTLDNLPYLTLSYANGPSNNTQRNLTGMDTEADNFTQPILVPLKHETHGGEDVAIYASGPMSHLFSGVREQHFIAHAMAYASCVGPNKKHCDGGKSSPLKSHSSQLNFCMLLIAALTTLTVGAEHIQ